MKMQISSWRFNKHLGIHRWREMESGRKAISIWTGICLVTIYF